MTWETGTIGVFVLAGFAALALCAVSHRRSLSSVISSRGEMAEAPDIESIPDEPRRQTCAIDASGLTGPDTAVLRANYLPLDDNDRYDLDLTFAAIVTPEEVEP